MQTSPDASVLRVELSGQSCKQEFDIRLLHVHVVKSPLTPNSGFCIEEAKATKKELQLKQMVHLKNCTGSSVARCRLICESLS